VRQRDLRVKTFHRQDAKNAKVQPKNAYITTEFWFFVFAFLGALGVLAVNDLGSQ